MVTFRISSRRFDPHFGHPCRVIFEKYIVALRWIKVSSRVLSAVMRRLGSEGQSQFWKITFCLVLNIITIILLNNRVRRWNVYESVGRYNVLNNEYRVKGVNADAKFLRIRIPVSATL